MEILLVILVVLVIIVIVAVLSTNTVKNEPEWKKILKTNIFKQEEKAFSTNYSEVKDSLIELDKLLDYYLKNKKIKGETLGERLKNASNLFSKNDYNSLWNAHKLRNQIVHEVEHNISLNLIKSHSRTVAEILKKSV